MPSANGAGEGSDLPVARDDAIAWMRTALRMGALLLAGGILFVYARRPGNDFDVYVASGEAVLQGKDIYEAPLPARNTGPPFFSLACVVPALLARVSLVFARGVWTLLNVAALVLALRTSSALVYRRPVALGSAGILVPLLLTLPFILYHLLYHQVNLIVFALTLGGMRLQEERREILGGVLVGAGSALKGMPVLFIPYLFYRRRWWAGGAALAATAFFTFCPGFVLGWDRLPVDLRYWWSILLRNPCWDAGSRNQSVLAMWDRILGHGLIPFLSPGRIYLEMSQAPVVRLAWLGTVAVTGVLLLAAFRRCPERGSVAMILEWSALFVVAAVFGPVSWKHYFVVFLLPTMVLDVLRRHSEDPGQRRVAAGILGGCLLLSLASVHALWGSAWCARMAMGSVLTLTAFLLLGGLLWLRWEMARGRGRGPGEFLHLVAPGNKVVKANLEAKTVQQGRAETEIKEESARAHALKIALAKFVEAALHKKTASALNPDVEGETGKPEVEVKILGDGKVWKAAVDGAPGAVGTPLLEKAGKKEKEPDEQDEKKGERGFGSEAPS